jgi:hypothetical protein
MRQSSASLRGGFLRFMPRFRRFIARPWNGGEPLGTVQSSQNTTQSPTTKELKMNVLKNMEVIFAAAASLALVTSYATASAPVIAVPAAAIAAVDVSPAKMPVVIVAAKRLTAAEKAALI